MDTANGIAGRSPSSGSLTSNMTNGQPASDFEVISRPPSSASVNNCHAPVQVSSLMAASVTSNLPSLTDITLTQALQRIQDLSRENQELREFLRSNAEVMKKQFQTLSDYKEKVRNANAYHREKFQQTKVLVLSMREEQAKLQEECDGLRSKVTDLESCNKALSQHRTIGDSVVTDLQKEVYDLQQKLAMAEKNDMIMVSEENLPADEETAKQMEKLVYITKENAALRDENTRLMKDVRQFKCTADQILADLEKTQSLKSDRDKECKLLGKENTRMSTEIQQTLKEVCTLREKNSALALQVKDLQKQLGSSSDGSFENVCVRSLRSHQLQSFSFGETSGKQPQQTSSSQTTESLAAARSSDEEEECKSLTLNSNAMADMLSQIQTERDTVASLRGDLAVKDAEIQRLEKELCSKEEVLLSKTTRIESSAEEVTAEQARVISDIQATTDKLCTAGAAEAKPNEDMMRSQVLTLINEVHESQMKLKAATDALDQKNKRVQELEIQTTALSSQLERQRALDDSFIDSMRLNLANLEQALAVERAEHQDTRKLLAEQRISFNSLLKDYRDLLDTFDEYRIGKEKEAMASRPDPQQSEKISELTAQIIGAEEAIGFRDTQIMELRQELLQVKQELEKIPVLKAQADVYKSDFDAERKAREKQHEEKEAIIQEMNNLQTRNQQLLDELESFSRNQIVEMQQKHTPGEFWHRPEPRHTYTFTPPQPSNPPTHQSRYPYPGPQESYTGAGARQHPQDDSFDYTQMDEIYGGHHCPKCGQQCPDIDSLNIHVSECLDRDNPTQDVFRM